MIRQLVGDCRQTLPILDAGVAQAVITSPPYFGLRDYGTPPLVWGGVEHEHEWGVPNIREFGRPQGQTGDRASRTYTCHDVATEAFCDCGAWLGSLGLEPTPELYIEHLVECFRHVRRVLRDDGVLWLNLGDSYAGSGNGQKDRRPSEASLSKRNQHARPDVNGWYTGSRYDQPSSPAYGLGAVSGYKAKDLMMMPFRVAMALQDDGWWLRSVIPWLKRNSMPESVTDRPATSIEYLFLLTKSARYFWDGEAVRMPNNDPERKVFTPGRKQYLVSDTSGREMRNHGLGFGKSADGSGRNRRNGDWFFESWQGLILDEADDPLALVVNPQPFSDSVRSVRRVPVALDAIDGDTKRSSYYKEYTENTSHFATFPAKLVEPMVKASTRPGDTVLDPFSGAGTVGLVADRLGRNAILCELKVEYASMGADRIVGDAPLFSEVAAD